MKPTLISMCAVTAVLAAAFGIAGVSAPDGHQADASADAPVQRKPVQRSTLTCPRPSTADFAQTEYSAFSPGGGEASGGRAELVPAPTSADQQGGTGTKPGDQNSKGGSGQADAGATGGDGQDDQSGATTGNDKSGGGSDTKKDKSDAKPIARLTTPGKPALADTDKADAPALIGTAEGRLAPGYTVQQTTEISFGAGKGMLGTSCTVPGADFWFAGASTAKDRQDYIHLTNPDAAPAVVDLELYGDSGVLDTPLGAGLNVPPHGSLPVLLSTLTAKDQPDLALHVVARSGRVGATLEAADDEAGADWLAPSADPAPSVVLPGLPKDTASAHLVVFAPGKDDADLTLRLATPTGAITPAGHESVHVKSGMTASIDLGKITQGEVGSLMLTPSAGAPPQPVVAALQLTRDKGGDEDTAFVSATSASGIRASAAGSGADSRSSTIFLVAPDKAAKVKITSSATTGGGASRSTTVQVKAGTTVAVTPPKPGGKGEYAVTVDHLSGGPVYASRMLASTEEEAMFTIQPMPDDRSTVAVPAAVADLSMLNH